MLSLFPVLLPVDPEFLDTGFCGAGPGEGLGLGLELALEVLPLSVVSGDSLRMAFLGMPMKPPGLFTGLFTDLLSFAPLLHSDRVLLFHIQEVRNKVGRERIDPGVVSQNAVIESMSRFVELSG